MGSKEIGLKSDVALGLWTLGMGTTDEISQLTRWWPTALDGKVGDW